MTPSTELFQLIKSLTKSEKRYFKLTSTLQKGSKNYIKLFDAIEAQEEYSEEEIKKLFKGTTFIKHLPSEKSHLYNLILKSLRAFHADRSAAAQLHEQLKNIEILYGKALYKECSKFIKRAKKLAHKYEKYYYLLDILYWEKMMVEEEYLSGKFDKDLNELIAEEEECINKLRNIAEYQMLYSKINYVFRRGGYTRNTEELKIVEEIEDYHLIKGKNTAISTKATTACYYIKALCATTRNDQIDSEVNFKKVIKVFEANPLIIKELPKRYLKALNSLMKLKLAKHELGECFGLIEKMETISQQADFKSVDVQIAVFTYVSMGKLLAYEYQGEYEKANDMIDDIYAGLEGYRDKINMEERTIFLYNFACNEFAAGDYKKALYWINQVLNESSANLRQDVYTFARLVNLLIHLELHNYDLLEYEIASTQRFMKKNQRNYKVETLIIKYLKKLIKDKGRTGDSEIYAAFREELVEAFEDPYEMATNKYFDLLAWVDSKIQRTSISEIKKLAYAGA